MDPYIDSGESIPTSILEKTQVTPTELNIFESNMEDCVTSNITKNISNTNSKVNMGEGILTSAVNTSVVTPPLPPPPPTFMIIPTSVHVVSPTFQEVMKEPIDALFSSQSTEPKSTINEEEEDDDMMVEFSNLEFDLEEDNAPDNAIMYGKKFKFLNSKLNSIPQFFK